MRFTAAVAFLLAITINGPATNAITIKKVNEYEYAQELPGDI